MTDPRNDDATRTRAGLGLAGLILGSTAFVALLLALLYAAGLERWALRLFDWIDSLGWAGLVIYGLIDMLAVIALAPGFVLTVGAGFLFGTFTGSVVIAAATTAGACVAFLLAQAFAGSRVAARLAHHPRMRAVVSGIVDDGWRTVLLTRLVPFFPFKASNYAFGLTTMRLRDFALGTALGIVPLTVVNVAIGALAGDVASVIASDRERAAWEWAVYAAGLIPLCILVVVIGRRAERRLAAQRADAVR